MYSATGDADEVAESILCVCFPDPPTLVQVEWDTPAAFMHLVSGDLAKREHFVVYLPNIGRAPYFYCCRFCVNPFTVPSFCSDRPVSERFAIAQGHRMVSSEICLVIQTFFPFRDLFNSLLDWIIQFERVGRFELANLFDAVCPSDYAWPRVAAGVFQELLAEWQALPFTCSSSFSFDRSPYPKFRWVNPGSDWPEYPLAVEALAVLLRHTTRRGLELVIRALFTEHSILVTGNRPCDVTDVVLSLHFLIHPLRWICPSVSLLPHAKIDLLEQPTAFLYGVAEISIGRRDDLVIVDLNRKTVTTGLDLPHLPDLTSRDGAKLQLKKALKRNWDLWPDDAARQIVRNVNLFAAKLLEPVPRSIMTNIGAPAGSSFIPELYLANFAVEERRFVKAVSETQMMQFQVQAICREQSNSFRAADPLERG
jgi:hypothetical protein